MTKQFTAGILAAVLALSACENISDQTKATAAGGVAGAVGAGVIAQLLGASSDWVAIASVAGAAAGAIVARNETTGQCYVSNGDGTYSKSAC